jgi:hypothetical protein
LKLKTEALFKKRRGVMKAGILFTGKTKAIGQGKWAGVGISWIYFGLRVSTSCGSGQIRSGCGSEPEE